jgi:hypothetical protein
MSLVSYKMTHDSGFAPNPFHGYLTLATCKPGIRRSGSRRVGDWIAGFTSAALCGDAVGRNVLVAHPGNYILLRAGRADRSRPRETGCSSGAERLRKGHRRPATRRGLCRLRAGPFRPVAPGVSRGSERMAPRQLRRAWVSYRTRSRPLGSGLPE